MCGIIGYTGPRAATPLLLESLRRLEYRGYDSAGVAVLDAMTTSVTVVKSERKVDELARKLDEVGMPAGHVGIGHTRWATHGRPTVLNAHPHMDCTGRIHLIHNGIIENYRELRAQLEAKGHELPSETDTEVVPHLIEDCYRGNLESAVRHALSRVDGAYALVVIHADEPDTVVAARLNAPLVLGLGNAETFISSDITALIPYTKRVMVLGEGEVAEARAGVVTVRSLDGTVVEPRIITVDWDAEQAQRGGYPHFMLKEIHEQPQALRQTLRDRVDPDTGLVRLAGLEIDDGVLAGVREVHVVACGTAYYAGMATAHAIETLARIPARVSAASEFRYADPLVDATTLVVAISQSGETADTLAAVREARRRGAPVLAVTNVVGSAINHEADGVILMQAGPEIAVASTKCFLAQLVCGVLLALYLAELRSALPVEELRALAAETLELPDKVEGALQLEPQVAELAQRLAHLRNAMYIGRGANVVTAFEGALKLKEVSYVHAEGYAAGELKHGPIALLDPDTPVVAVATRSATLAKTVSNVQEVNARMAPVVAVVTAGENPFDDMAADILEVPAVRELLSPVVNVVPLQLLAYHIAVQRGCDVDQPRNLAKSVTVE